MNDSTSQEVGITPTSQSSSGGSSDPTPTPAPGQAVFSPPAPGQAVFSPPASGADQPVVQFTAPTSDAAPSAAKAPQKKNEEKWTKPLMDAGYIMIPSVIVARQRALGLDAIDLAIILHLIRFWWERDNLPHPSVETIATLIDADRRTVQRRLKKLETAKLITRRARRSRFGDNDTNQYDFTGLIEAATPHAKAMIAERDEAIANKQRKNIRGRKRSTSGQEEQS